VFDVLAYIAFTLPPITRAARVATHREEILSRYDAKLQAFIDFVLGQYVSQGVEELDQDKLAHLLEVRYQTLHDATAELGTAPVIRSAFVGFQEFLFNRDAPGGSSHP
jgi:type I restriction enzyme R subunit